jgi:hypothetical protein
LLSCSKRRKGPICCLYFKIVSIRAPLETL